MPRHWNPCSYLPRRLQVVASLSTLILFCLIFLGRSNPADVDPYLNRVPLGPELASGVQHAYDVSHNIANKLNPFKVPAHKPPPEQSNSTSGEVRWYSDWKWKNPFSSSVTFEEERAVLPPLQQRPAVYTYYDTSDRTKSEKMRDAERALLQIWRRAWWAQGFSPVILTESEAERNPLYRQVQGKTLEPELELELMQWLAWGNMGTGIFSNWLALPMAAYDDHTLSFLRRGEFPALTGYKDLSGGVYYGTREHIQDALKQVVNSPALLRIKSISEGLPPEYPLQEDSPEDAIAFYNKKTLQAKYAPIRDLLANETTVPDALATLAPVINAHLHNTWQNLYPKGIAVVEPFPEFSHNLVAPAWDVARNLSRCPGTPLPNSCPPNRPSCKPCVSNKVRAATAPGLRNDSAVFTIATVPHPYTFLSLTQQRDRLDISFVRRETARDGWVLAASDPIFGDGPSSFARLPFLKDAVALHPSSPALSIIPATTTTPAGDDATDPVAGNALRRSLWLTPEREPGRAAAVDPVELDWIFGFALPRDGDDGDGDDDASAAGDAPGADAPLPPSANLALERTRLAAAEKALQSDVRTRNMVEAWNLADTEIWKFVRAFNARRRVERAKWEEAEKGFQGKGAFGRWVDTFT